MLYGKEKETDKERTHPEHSWKGNQQEPTAHTGQDTRKIRRSQSRSAKESYPVIEGAAGWCKDSMA